MIEYTDDEMEEERAKRIADLTDLEELHERYEHPIAYSEVLHAAFMLMETVDTYLSDSPSVLFDKEAYRQSQLASTALFNLYQRLGTLRYELERKPKGINLDFGTMVGAWNEVFFILGQADLSNAVKASLAKTLFIYVNENEQGQQPPQLTSFRQMIGFLEDHAHLPVPGLNVNLAGQFTLCYSDDSHRLQLCFKYIIDLVQTVSTTNRETELSVSYDDQPISSFKLPEWLVSS